MVVHAYYPGTKKQQGKRKTQWAAFTTVSIGGAMSTLHPLASPSLTGR